MSNLRSHFERWFLVRHCHIPYLILRWYFWADTLVSHILLWREILAGNVTSNIASNVCVDISYPNKTWAMRLLAKRSHINMWFVTWDVTVHTQGFHIKVRYEMWVMTLSAQRSHVKIRREIWHCLSSFLHESKTSYTYTKNYQEDWWLSRLPDEPLGMSGKSDRI